MSSADTDTIFVLYFYFLFYAHSRPELGNRILHIQYFAIYCNILLPEANIAICMVCQRRILRYCIPRLQYIVILEASLFNTFSQGRTELFLLLAKKRRRDKLEFSISYYYIC